MSMTQKVYSYLVAGLTFGGFLAWLIYPVEKYCPIVEQVQDKAVMITVPTTMVQVSITFDKKKVKVEESTATIIMGGSGVLVSPTGSILSCAHVFDFKIAGPIVATLSDGTTLQARLLYSDPAKDLALLKIEGHYPYAKLSSRRLRLGQEVIAVGNPHFQSFSTSHGIISHLNRDIKEAFTFTQIDAPINGGNSGGPLFNLQGELIGINARAWTGSDGLALAISPHTIKEFLAYFNLN